MAISQKLGCQVMVICDINEILSNMKVWELALDCQMDVIWETSYWIPTWMPLEFDAGISIIQMSSKKACAGRSAQKFDFLGCNTSPLSLGLFTVGIFGPFFIPFLGHSHDSHYFHLLFSFILINGGNEKVRMEEKSKEK